MLGDDAIIKLSFMTCLTIIYCVTFLTQKFDLATISTLISSFTNAVVGIVTYNLTKKKYEKKSEGGSK